MSKLIDITPRFLFEGKAFQLLLDLCKTHLVEFYLNMFICFYFYFNEEDRFIGCKSFSKCFRERENNYKLNLGKNMYDDDFP